MSAPTLLNFINGSWVTSTATEFVDVVNPASAEVLARAPLSGRSDVNAACVAAEQAFVSWRRTPVADRIQHLFRLKNLLEANVDEMARIITNECGKTLAESLGELRRGIENVEVACGMPLMMQGYNNEDIARGIDEHMIRQPVGVTAAITPFNFPGMIPLWFMPYALAAGNCFILKPSERVPMAARRLFDLLGEAGFPPGVVQLVHGGKDAVDALLQHPTVRAVSFVGSSPVAQYIYTQSAIHGKRVQCQGGAKNMVVIMPDADREQATRIVADSAFGCAGQRCLANSLAITVGEARDWFRESIGEAAATRRVGYGLEEGIEMGPVITAESRARINGFVDRADRDGARIIVDGRGKSVDAYPDGFWSFPTLIDDVHPDSELARSEVFGPVFGLMHVDSLSAAIDRINAHALGNMACIFTESGEAAREFRYGAEAGNVGVNIGVAAPMAFFPFSGWKGSFFGDLHGQGRHGVEFYTQTKVVIERWPRHWSRKF